MKKLFKLIIRTILLIAVLFAAANSYIIFYSSQYIKALPKSADCIIVLGAGVRKDGTPSPMLEDRLKIALSVYSKGISDKIIVSGDHGKESYNEVGAMKDYLTQNGIPEENIFMDHAGFSTYESIYRAKNIFGVESAVVVTQKYHLYRAVFDARKLGITAYGADAALRRYALQSKYSLRESIARAKDFLCIIFKPQPKFLGEAIPISGTGLVTEDRY